MHKEGVEVSLRRRDCDAYIREHQNSIFRPGKLGCYARSCLVSAAPGTPFVVDIKLREGLLTHDMMVVITCGPPEGPIDHHKNYQAWYIPSRTKETKYEFLSFDVWEDPALPPKEMAMTMPSPDNGDIETMTDTTWIEEVSASMGCVSVFVERGRLDRKAQTEDRALTEPPWSPTDVTEYSVINREWFVPSHGGTYPAHVFEFRNMTQEKLAELQSAPTNAAIGISANSSRQLSRPLRPCRRSLTKQRTKRKSDEDHEQPPTKRKSQRLGHDAETSYGVSSEPPLGSFWMHPGAAQRASDDEDDDEVSIPTLKEESHDSAGFGEPAHEPSFTRISMEQEPQNERALSPNSNNVVSGDGSTVTSGSRASSDWPSMISGAAQKNSQSMISDSDDEEDLKDEMRQLEIKRRLRAMVKKSQGIFNSEDDEEDLKDEMRHLEIKRKLRAKEKVRKA